MVQNKNIRLKYSIIRFAPLILVIYFVMEAFATFQNVDKNAVIQRNKDYIKDITLAMTIKLDYELPPYIPGFSSVTNRQLLAERPWTGEEILRLFRDIRAERPECAIVMITHNAEVAALADRSDTLADGVIRTKEAAE